MTKFRPTQFDDSVNIAQEHPLKEFFSFLAKGLLCIALIYFCLGFLFEFLITRISIEREVWLWQRTGIADRYVSKLEKPYAEREEQQEYIEALFNRIPDTVKPSGYPLSVKVTYDKDPNAFALPGGAIVVTSGLLDVLETENALMFVLGHELGHIKNRDHLRGMGFGMISVVLSGVLAGQDAGVLSAVSGVMDMGFLGYSRHQESQADMVGLQTLIATYGYANGATEFFEKIMSREGKLEKFIPSIMTTHPDSEKRERVINAYVRKHHPEQGRLIPIKRFN